MTQQRRSWIANRFGNIEDTILGHIEDVNDIVWVDIVKTYDVQGRKLTYRVVSDIEKSAERIAEIFRNGAYEMVNNSEIEWHRDPKMIINKVQTGDWNFYVCYFKGEMIAAESMRIIRGDRTMEWVWGCVDPVYRGMGVWRNIGIYTDRVVEMSGAQLGSVWVVTTHKYSQMAVESAGYLPTGCFVGKRLYGGNDNRYYRASLLHYAKVYGAARRHLQNWGSMVLTEKAAKVVNLLRILWSENN